MPGIQPVTKKPRKNSPPDAKLVPQPGVSVASKAAESNNKVPSAQRRASVKTPKAVTYVNDLKAKHFTLGSNEPLPLSVTSFRKRLKFRLEVPTPLRELHLKVLRQNQARTTILELTPHTEYLTPLRSLFAGSSGEKDTRRQPIAGKECCP